MKADHYETLKQLGGNRFLFMIGAKWFDASDDALTVRFTGRAKGGVNFLRVTLDPSDTYTVEFMRHTAKGTKPNATYHGVYCDGLAELFESVTGLYTKV